MEKNLIEIPCKNGESFINLNLIHRIELEEAGENYAVRFSGVNGSSDFHAFFLKKTSSTLLTIRAWIEKHRLEIRRVNQDGLITPPPVNES